MVGLGVSILRRWLRLPIRIWIRERLWLSVWGYYDSYYGGTDYGYGYPSGGYEDSYYGGTGYENGYPTHSRVAELQRRLVRAGYYSGAIDGMMGPATRRAINAYEREHGFAG